MYLDLIMHFAKIHEKVMNLIRKDIIRDNSIVIKLSNPEDVLGVFQSYYGDYNIFQIYLDLGFGSLSQIQFNKDWENIPLVIFAYNLGDLNYILNIVGGETPEALVVLVVVVVAELSLQFQVVNDFPAEAASHVQVFALLLTVVVSSSCHRIVEVTQVVVGTCRWVEVCQGNRGVDDRIS